MNYFYAVLIWGARVACRFNYGKHCIYQWSALADWCIRGELLWSTHALSHAVRCWWYFANCKCSVGVAQHVSTGGKYVNAFHHFNERSRNATMQIILHENNHLSGLWLIDYKRHDRGLMPIHFSHKLSRFAELLMEMSYFLWNSRSRAKEHFLPNGKWSAWVTDAKGGVFELSSEVFELLTIH